MSTGHMSEEDWNALPTFIDRAVERYFANNPAKREECRKMGLRQRNRDMPLLRTQRNFKRLNRKPLIRNIIADASICKIC